MQAMVVEDDESTRDFLEVFLNRMGFTVTGCADAETAWSKYQSGNFPLLLIDWLLPGKDGLHLCQQIKRHPNGPFSTVLICTARRSVDDLEHVLNFGADDYLQKPLDIDLLRVRISIAERRAKLNLRQRDTENALEETSGRYSTLTDAVPIGIFETDVYGRCIYINSCWEKITGLSAEEGLELGWLDSVHPDDKKAMTSEWRRCVADGQEFNLEHRLLRTDGAVRWAHACARPSRARDGKILGYVGTVEDITARKRAELALKENESRFRRVVDSNMIGIFFWRTGGPLTDANDTFLNMSGYSRDDLVAGRVRLDEMTPVEYTWLDDQARRELKTRGICSPFEKEFIRKDGARIPVLIGAGLLEGDTDNGVAFVLDISERKRLEDQLRKTQKLESIGRLAGGIAHDFNNLLTVIIGRAELLLLRMDYDPNKTEVELIHGTALRAARLTRQLLQFSRQSVCQPRLIEVNALISSMAEMLRRILGEDITLELNLFPKDTTIQADPSQVEQIVMNIAANGRDAMRGGGVMTISTSVSKFDEAMIRQNPGTVAGDYVELSISDTGRGMDAVTLSRVFEPFFTTKPDGEGTGLGLATVYGIVKQNSGFILVDSEVGRGATFRIYLPKKDPIQSSHIMPAVQLPTPRSTGRILVVEDEENIAELIHDVLAAEGYSVAMSRNGVEALEMSNRIQNEIHLLITDVIMPAMNGPQLARQLTRVRPELKVLFISGYPRDAFTNQGISVEGINFLEKPFTSDAMVRKVCEILQS